MDGWCEGVGDRNFRGLTEAQGNGYLKRTRQMCWKTDHTLNVSPEGLFNMVTRIKISNWQ